MISRAKFEASNPMSLERMRMPRMLEQDQTKGVLEVQEQTEAKGTQELEDWQIDDSGECKGCFEYPEGPKLGHDEYCYYAMKIAKKAKKARQAAAKKAKKSAEESIAAALAEVQMVEETNDLQPEKWNNGYGACIECWQFPHQALDYNGTKLGHDKICSHGTLKITI